MTVLYKGAVPSPRPAQASGTTLVAKTLGLGSAAPALYRLLSESALKRAALDVCAAPVAIVTAAPDPALVHANPAFEDLFALPAGAAPGRSLRDILAPTPHSMGDWLPWGGTCASITISVQRSDGASPRLEAIAGSVRNTRGERTHWVLTLLESSRP